MSTPTSTERAQPWHGVIVATTLPFRESASGELDVDLAEYGKHVAWLAANGCDGVAPNGSLGEYQNLSDEERAAVVRTAVENAPAGFTVMPGVGAYGAHQARKWADQAAEAGAQAVMLLPPNTYRAEPRAVIEHYREVAKAGLPICAYNNPIDTKVDLVPSLLAELHKEGLIVAVKEFTGDVRRAYEITEAAPGLEIMVGSDDVLLEVGITGAVGWLAGYPNALPRETVALYNAVKAGDLETALPLYRIMHRLLRWDSKTEFVQSIKLSMDLAGRYGGPSRAPRLPLREDQHALVTADTLYVLEELDRLGREGKIERSSR